jgi:glutathione synthase/RimK-type ligase-like ATP-grasp enzyme
MNILLVVNNPNNWPLQIPGVKVVAARTYLTDPAFSEGKKTRVFNLCRSYSYQRTGYYVSLLAAARGHKPMPDINTIQDLKSPHVIQAISEDMEELIEKKLGHLQSKRFTLSIYFGRNIAKHYDSLSLRLFNLFQAPLLQAKFIKRKTWRLESIRTMTVNDIPENHQAIVIEAASNYFSGRKRRIKKDAATRFDLAILYDPNEKEPPSDEKALKKFQKAAESVGLECEFITKNDVNRLAEFDGLFIRETTLVDHHTFRFAQRAVNEGLIVMDDPNSILKCTNKVYLAELMTRHNIPIPKTMIVHRYNIDQIEKTLGLPCILKKPDSAFSMGVSKAENREDLIATVKSLLEDSDLIIAQQFLPTNFDWRIGICDRRPLYACRYHMADKHWQIIKRDASGNSTSEGNADTMAIGEAPDEVVSIALKAANLIGDSLYGVDLKQVGQKFYLIEINDNPSIDSGCEDLVLKDALYREIMGVFIKRIEARKLGLYGR